ncbi:MAG: hypothetical protein IPK32_21560 [Verrucomicrobiaceae bacterium]|nr:hypothetical protein [Verrucomicrobiaceae bacterium]
MRRTIITLLLLTTAAVAADTPRLPRVPSKPIAVKKELLFEDDFSASTPAKPWHRVVDTFTFENGELKGNQTRVVDSTAPDGKVIKAHAAVHGLEIPTQDSIVECRIKFDGATMIDVEFDDRKFTGCHYGHICRAQVRLNGITIIDEKDGNMRNDIYEMKKDPAKKAEVAKLLIGRQATFPAKLETGKWYTLLVETIGDAMRVSIDGKSMAYLQSSGIAHATKSKIELGVAGKTGSFDDLKVWNAESAKKK